MLKAPLLVILATACVLFHPSPSSAAKYYSCGLSWDVPGQVLKRIANVNTPASCQDACSATNTCTWFVLYEDYNNPKQKDCTLMKQQAAGGGKWNPNVVAICSKISAPTVWKSLGIPQNFTTTDKGTLAPLRPGLSGAYEVLMYSTGVVAIHTALIPNSKKVLVWGLPQWDVFSFQPGMEISQYAAWTTALLDMSTGTYIPIAMENGAPFCAHAITLPDGDILVCGGDSQHFHIEGIGQWGGVKGCRLFTIRNGPPRWVRLPDLQGPHWYPSMLEIPPGTAGSSGTCALVLGGLTSGAYNIPTNAVDLYCPGDADKVISMQNNAASGGDDIINRALTSTYPTAVLLPIGAPPASPQIFLVVGEGAVVTQLDINRGQKNMFFKTLKKLPGPQSLDPNWNMLGPGTSAVLLALDLSRGVQPQDVTMVLFGGIYGWDNHDITPVKQAYSIKPLSGDTSWKVEQMPGPALLRAAVVAPNGKVILINGNRAGSPSGTVQGAPIVQAWEYDPSKPQGSRFTVDPAMSTHHRMYHGNAFLGPDGTVHLTGGDQDVMPFRKAAYTYDRYIPASIRLAIALKTRPTIKSSPLSAKFGATLAVRYTGKASRCSLVRSAPTTHLSDNNQRVLILKTKSNAGGVIRVVLPTSPYVAPTGWWMLFCWDGQVWSEGKWFKLA